MSVDTNQKIQTRRGFLAGGALLGSGLFTRSLHSAESPDRGAAADGTSSRVLNSARPDAPYDLIDPRNILYSACLQCNTGCGIKCKLQDGVVTKIDGNPYSPW